MLVSVFSFVMKPNIAGTGITLFLRAKNEVCQVLIYVGNVNPIIVKISQKNSRIKQFLFVLFCITAFRAFIQFSNFFLGQGIAVDADIID